MSTRKRGEVWLADLSAARDALPAALRPVVVLQAQALLDAVHPSTLVAPLTTSLVDDAAPLRLRIEASDTLEQDVDDRGAGAQSGNEPRHGVEVGGERRIRCVPEPPPRGVAADRELPAVDGDDALVSEPGEIRSPLPRSSLFLRADPGQLA